MVVRKVSNFSHIWVVGGIVGLSLVIAAVYGLVFESKSGFFGNQADERGSENNPNNQPGDGKYPARTTIATEFWVGEGADTSNAFIPNHGSAWTTDWVSAYGGIDDPDDRCDNYMPCGFTPRENAFYVALPFNDIDDNGKPKDVSVLRRVPWFDGKSQPGVSIMKNRWVEIRYDSKTAYGQIEDVGPMNEDDIEYVFGDAKPKYEAGIDLSPAIGDYLGTTGKSVVTWRFVEATDVPDGPWTRTVTTSQINW